ncbi:MAG TPA: LytTR family DNA-binding domain-containing protein [Prolixibacteraceae bacterium]|nr:LytTR family DNA-binding domain-containing protein [Prolixibacteraceae bacterium]
MKVLIIEDEQPQARQLEQFIAQIDPEIQVLALIASVNDAVSFLKANLVDLIFLDIHLADGLCFEIFDQVNVTCPVIFTTAYDKYAIAAFKHNGIDYLLKPIAKDELKKSIDKFKQFTLGKTDISQLINTLNSLSLGSLSLKRRFVSNAGKKLRIVNDTEIAYFYALDGSVFIRTHKNENLLLDETLENIEKQIDSYNFFRLNRKVIAHVSAIKEMIPFSKSRLKIILNPSFDEEVLVSYNNMKDFMMWIKK